MIAQVIFRAEALEHVVDAARWYEERPLGLGEELIDAMQSPARQAGKTSDSS